MLTMAMLVVKIVMSFVSTRYYDSLNRSMNITMCMSRNACGSCSFDFGDV